MVVAQSGHPSGDNVDGDAEVQHRLGDVTARTQSAPETPRPAGRPPAASGPLGDRRSRRTPAKEITLAAKPAESATIAQPAPTVAAKTTGISGPGDPVAAKTI